MSEILTPESQSTPIGWKRTLLRIEDQNDADKLNGLLGEGWKLDPELPTTRLNDVYYQGLVLPGTGDLPSIVYSRPVVVEAPEALEGFLSIPPDSGPNGEVAKYLADGWIYVSYSGTKDKVQLKKPKTGGS